MSKGKLALTLRYLVVVALGFWQGGFLFYSLLAIPAGTRVHGRLKQGFVTQLVTDWLNGVGFATLLFLLAYMFAERSVVARRRGPAISWGVMALMQTLVIPVHWRLSALMDPATQDVVERPVFGYWHQAYLLIVAIQLLAALVHLWQWMQIWTAPDAPVSPVSTLPHSPPTA